MIEDPGKDDFFGPGSDQLMQSLDMTKEEEEKNIIEVMGLIEKFSLEYGPDQKREDDVRTKFSTLIKSLVPRYAYITLFMVKKPINLGLWYMVLMD